MSLQNRDKAELIRLKMKMEIIRTVAPCIMILIQLFIIIGQIVRIISIFILRRINSALSLFFKLIVLAPLVECKCAF